MLFSALIAFNPWKIFMKKEFVPFNNTELWFKPIWNCLIPKSMMVLPVPCLSVHLTVCNTEHSQLCLICLIADRIDHGLQEHMRQVENESLPGINPHLLCFRFLAKFSWFVFSCLKTYFCVSRFHACFTTSCLAS